MSRIAPYPSFVSNTLYISGILAIYGLVVGALITQGCILFEKTLFGNQVVYISWEWGQSVGRVGGMSFTIYFSGTGRIAV